MNQNPVELLLEQNDLDGAFNLLKITENVDLQSVTLTLSRWNELKQNVKKGLLTVGDSDYRKPLAQIKYVVTEIAKEVKSWPAQPSIPSPQPSTNVNKVSVVKNVFKAIKEDLENMAYSKSTVIGYTDSLNAAFESKIFTTFTDSLTRGDWDDMNSAEQKEACKKVLQTLSQNEEKVVERMIQFQSKLNGTVSLDESIQSFFNRPSIKSWNELSEQLTNRFSDTSLFGEKVIHAFNGWKQKLNGLEDDLSFAMDFNFDYRADFGAFLQTNLSPKNFNY